jgi:hypothetical protein
MTNEQLEFAIDLLDKTLKSEPKTFGDGNLIVYTVDDTVPERFMVIDEGWDALENWHNTPTRWTSNNATISVYSPENIDSNLSFNVVSFYNPRTLQVCLNDELLHKQNIPTSFVEVEIPVELKEGENILKFYTPNGCQRPCDIPELKNRDSRCLSLAFQNITIT